MPTRPIAILCAMQAEADPIIASLGLAPTKPPWPGHLPMQHWQHPTEPITLTTNGTDPRHNVDLIGTTPATLATHAIIEHTNPAAILVAGACGGHSQRTEIGRVHLINRAFHHDRRIPLPGFDAYGIGPEPLHQSNQLSDAFQAPIATISTGNALDTLPQELAFFDKHNVTTKDMETASIAWTASHYNTPVIALRAVTDFFDHPTPEHQFLANFNEATNNLAAAVERGMPTLLKAILDE
ncbi:MAG: hypothetical protein AB8F26_01665 [Phycisphaerales bacterium]